MGAGDGCGPERNGQAGQAGIEDGSKQHVRHEHADDEQCLRHGDVVERCLSGSQLVLDPTPASRRGFSFQAATGSAAARSRYSSTPTSSARRCRSNVPA